MAFSDLRYGTGDIGYGSSLDIIAKKSTDNGATWGAQQTVLKSNSNASDYTYAFGDASTVVDRESGAILLMDPAGTIGFFGSTYQRVARSVSTDNGQTWKTSDITNKLYQNDEYLKHLFFSSGRMIQSTIVKKGSYYRIYAAVNTRIQASNLTSNNGGSRVVYSDDFGETWNYLGGISAMPAPAGDECKVEELPNGNILLSCRTFNQGRYYNVFTFTDEFSGSGSWGATATSGSSNISGQVYGASCNGEILLVPAQRNTDGKQMYVLLQSIPANKERYYVSIYWKPLTAETDYDSPSDFVSGWSKYQVSTTTSAYSTMVLDNQGDVAFFYEENSSNSGYDMQFVSLPLSTITGGAYSYSPSPDGSYHTTSEPTALQSNIAVKAPKFSVNPGTYSVAQTVGLTCDTEGAKIYYTTDGSVPSESSTLYTGPITISESTTLRAIAIDAEGNKSFVSSAAYSIVTVDINSKLGTTISLDYNSSHQLFSNGASGADKTKQFFGFLRHDIAHVQLISSNTAELSTKGAGVFAQNNNNMLFDSDSHYLGFWNGSLDSGSRTEYCYFSIVAPKGYRFTRYSMEFDPANSTATDPTIQQYVYDADGAPVYDDDDLFAVSSTNTKLDKTLSNGSNVLYFRVNVNSTDAGYSLLLKSLQVTYVIDQPFTGQVPNGDGGVDIHTGLLDLGTFSYNDKTNSYWSFDRDRVVTDGQDVNVVSSTGEKQTEIVTVDGDQYFVAAANGDYYIEAPQKFRLTGASINFLRSNVEGSSSKYIDATTLDNGKEYIITDGNGNYLNLSEGSIITGNDPKAATKWTVTSSTSKDGYSRYYIKSGNYYLRVYTNPTRIGVSTSNSSGCVWPWDATYHCFRVSTNSNSPNYLVYNEGWIFSNEATNLSKLQYESSVSENAYTAADFTATVFNRENDGTAKDGERSLTSTAPTATVSLNDYNNDAIHFKIEGLTPGSVALYNVNLTILPLNPEVQTLQVAADIGGKAVGSNEVTSLNYNFNSGNPVKVLVPKNATSPYSIVFREAENEEKTLWYTTGRNNNSTSRGGYSNFYLVNSAANEGDYLNLEAEPWPAARINATQAGTQKLLATNIEEVVNGTASELKDNDFDKAEAKYEAVSLADNVSKTVYVYSADEPTFQIMPAGLGSKHIDYRYYEITVEPVVENEKPVITITPIYTETLKNAPSKTTSSIGSDGSTLDTNHTYVGISVTSESESTRETAYGVLTNTEIIEAIKAALAEKNYYGFTAADPYRGILYVDMSNLTAVTSETTDGENHWDAFHKGTADNCLYFMPEGFTRNVENTITKRSGEYEAVGDVVVCDQQPFFTPYSFVTGTRHAKYERKGTVSGQTGNPKAEVKNMTSVLPFDVNLTKEGYLKTSADAVDNSICFHDITGFGEVTSVASGSGKEITYAMRAKPVDEGTAYANQPYYVTSANTGFTFTIAGARFASTGTVNGGKVSFSELIRAKADAWTAIGTYSGVQPKKADDLWYFSKEYFWKSGQLQNYSNVNIRPFRAYYTTTAATGSSVKATVVFDDSELSETTGISGINTDRNAGLQIAVGKGFISVKATSAARLSVSNVAGQVVVRADMAKGEHRTIDLPLGIYVVNGTKVAVR